MIIRKLKSNDDYISVSRVYAESWKYAYKGIVPQYYLDGISEENWVEKLKSSNRQTLIAIKDGQVIGVSGFGPSRSDEYKGQGEVYSIYFLPQYTEKGYGKQLINSAVCELEILGYKDIFLWVFEDNIRARKFYESVGFVSSGEKKAIEIGKKTIYEVRYCLHI